MPTTLVNGKLAREHAGRRLDKISCVYPSDEGLSVYFHDVTARKQAEATLRQNEALFSTLIEQPPLGVYVVDRHVRRPITGLG